VRRSLIVLTTALVVAGAAGSVAAATDLAPAISGPQTLVLLAQIDRQQQVDAAPVGFSLADQLVLAGALSAAGGGDRGRFGAACTVTDTLAEGTFQCQVTLALPAGLVTLQGLLSPVGPRSTYAVTGGTGRYRNARGSATAYETSPDQVRLTMSLLP
jgi:hypothetical protein